MQGKDWQGSNTWTRKILSRLKVPNNKQKQYQGCNKPVSLVMCVGPGLARDMLCFMSHHLVLWSPTSGSPAVTQLPSCSVTICSFSTAGEHRMDTTDSGGLLAIQGAELEPTHNYEFYWTCLLLIWLRAHNTIPNITSWNQVRLSLWDPTMQHK